MYETLSRRLVLLAGVSVEIGAVHPKAMPCILTTPEKWETWLSAEWATAGKLQRPPTDGELKVVANGGKLD